MLPAVWPEAGSKVYTTFDMVVGPGGHRVEGRVAVLASGEPIAAGDAVTAGPGVTMFEPGADHGEVTLPAGQQAVTIQVVDADGRSMGAEMSHQVSYEVVEAPASRRVFFKEPADGVTVSSPFKVVFGVEGMGMSPALENTGDKTVGHHHILINLQPSDASRVIPNDATHLHYGKAQTETELTLDPGEYSLTMQFADGNHRSYGERLAATIKVTVE